MSPDDLLSFDTIIKVRSSSRAAKFRIDFPRFNDFFSEDEWKFLIELNTIINEVLYSSLEPLAGMVKIAMPAAYTQGDDFKLHEAKVIQIGSKVYGENAKIMPIPFEELSIASVSQIMARIGVPITSLHSAQYDNENCF